MFMLVCQAYLLLIRMDFYLARRKFSTLYEIVRRAPVSRVSSGMRRSEVICRAIDIASVWYWKQVLCLQRSAAATCLLRRQGVAAELVIGAQSLPFRAHAWVEVDGEVVNDRPYISELYAIVDRC